MHTCTHYALFLTVIFRCNFLGPKKKKREKKKRETEKKRGPVSVLHSSFTAYENWITWRLIWLGAAVLNTRDKNEARTTPTQPSVNLSRTKEINSLLPVSHSDIHWGSTGSQRRKSEKRLNWQAINWRAYVRIPVNLKVTAHTENEQRSNWREVNLTDHFGNRRCKNSVINAKVTTLSEVQLTQ